MLRTAVTHGWVHLQRMLAHSSVEQPFLRPQPSTTNLEVGAFVGEPVAFAVRRTATGYDIADAHLEATEFHCGDCVNDCDVMLLVKDREPAVRIRAVESLGFLQLAAAATVLETALADRDAGVRIRATEVMGHVLAKDFE